jgi:hypothetical protein
LDFYLPRIKHGNAINEGVEENIIEILVGGFNLPL